MLQLAVRRPWAPRGPMPIRYRWDRHDRRSGIVALTISPRCRRLSLYFQLHLCNIRFGQGMAFLRWLHQHRRRKFILVLDRYSVHRKAIRLLQAQHPDGLEVEGLPAYAPDLNPVEWVWNHTPYADLANFIPEELDDLEASVTLSLEKTHATTHLLRSFFRHAKL